jgi:hypothetical protein
MSIEWDSRSRNLESKIIEQHQSLYDEKKNKKKVIGGPVESFSNIVSVAYSWSYQGMMARS